jgi:3'(2'), 5'-bisphosphate nucleotidase
MSTTPSALATPALLQSVCHLVQQAGRLVMQVYAQPIVVQHKGDQSPVTQADALAEALITAGLHTLTPGVPIVAEEAVSAGQATSTGKLFWLVDPLDGTKEFIQRNGEFTVNVALVAHGLPVLGVVLAPALPCLYLGLAGHGAWVLRGDTPYAQRQAIACRPVPKEGLTVVSSRSHGDEHALAQLLQGQQVAQGQADCYPRLGRTMEWDIAAGHAVLAAAGGHIRCLPDGQPLRYGKPGLDNPHFVARGRVA